MMKKNGRGRKVSFIFGKYLAKYLCTPSPNDILCNSSSSCFGGFFCFVFFITLYKYLGSRRYLRFSLF